MSVFKGKSKVLPKSLAKMKNPLKNPQLKNPLKGVTLSGFKSGISRRAKALNPMSTTAPTPTTDSVSSADQVMYVGVPVNVDSDIISASDGKESTHVDDHRRVRVQVDKRAASTSNDSEGETVFFSKDETGSVFMQEVEIEEELVEVDTITIAEDETQSELSTTKHKAKAVRDWLKSKRPTTMLKLPTRSRRTTTERSLKPTATQLKLKTSPKQKQHQQHEHGDQHQHHHDQQHQHHRHQHQHQPHSHHHHQHHQHQHQHLHGQQHHHQHQHPHHQHHQQHQPGAHNVDQLPTTCSEKGNNNNNPAKIIDNAQSHDRSLLSKSNHWVSIVKGKLNKDASKILDELMAERTVYQIDGFGHGILITTPTGIRCASLHCDDSENSEEKTNAELTIDTYYDNDHLAIAELSIVNEVYANRMSSKSPHEKTPRPVDIITRTFEKVATLVTSELVAQVCGVFCFKIENADEAACVRWTVDLKNGDGAVALDNQTIVADAEICLSRKTMLRWLDQSLDPVMAVFMGQVKVSGDTMLALKLSSLQPLLNIAREELQVELSEKTPEIVKTGSLKPGVSTSSVDSADSAGHDSEDSDECEDSVLEPGSNESKKTCVSTLPPELNLLDPKSQEQISFECGKSIPMAWLRDEDDEVEMENV